MPEEIRVPFPWGVEIMATTEALALADAIYLASGKLPRVEDWQGGELLKMLTDGPVTAHRVPDDIYPALRRLLGLGLITTYLPEGGVWAQVALTASGREFVEGMK